MVTNVTSDMEQHFINNGVDTVAKLARTTDTLQDFLDFVVQPFLEFEGVTEENVAHLEVRHDGAGVAAC